MFGADDMFQISGMQLPLEPEDEFMKIRNELEESKHSQIFSK